MKRWLLIIPLLPLTGAPQSEPFSELNRIAPFIAAPTCEQSMTELRRLVDFYPSSLRAHWLLADNAVACHVAADQVRWVEERLKESPRSGLLWYQLGWAMFAQKDFAQSALAFQKCTEFIEGWADCYIGFAGSRSKSADFEQALQWLKQAATRKPEDPGPLFGIAKLYCDRLHWKQARQAVEAGLALLQDQKEPMNAARAIDFAIGEIIARSQQEFGRVLELQERLLAVARMSGDRKLMHSTTIQIAGSLARVGRSTEAVALLREQLAEEPPGTRAESETLMALATVLQTAGESEEALGLQMRVEQTSARIGDVQNQMSAQHEQGKTLTQIGDPYRSEPILVRHVEFAHKAGNVFYEAFARRFLAHCYAMMGRYWSALEQHKRSTELFRSVGHRQVVSAALGYTGEVYAALGDLARARSYHLRALRMAREFNDGEGIQRHLRNLSELQSQQGLHAQALAALDEATVYARKVGMPRYIAAILVRRARLLRNLGRFAEAVKSGEEAEALASKQGLLELEAQAHVELSENWARLGKQLESVAALLKAENLANRLGGDPLKIHVERALASARLREGQFGKALEHLKVAMTAAERTRGDIRPLDARMHYFENKDQLYRDAVRIALRDTSNPDAVIQAFEFAERGRALTLAEARRNDGEVVREIDARRVAARENVEILSYTLLPGTSYLWHTNAAGTRLVRLASKGAIEALAGEYRALLAKPNGAVAPDIGHRLYRELLGRVGSSLRGKRIVIIPDGALHMLPFEALRDGGGFVGETATVSYAPSVKALLFGRGPGGYKAELLAYGDPGKEGSGIEASVRSVYTASGLRLRALPGAREEIATIAAFFPASKVAVRAGEAASETAFKAEDLRAYRRIHIASHAVFDPVLRSRNAILLGRDEKRANDGLLELTEIYKLNLRAELVVLSACQTGFGKIIRGEGVDSVARGFLAAGAEGVVYSLWEVSDRATAAFMTAFYGELAKGRAPADSLREARLSMMRSTTAAYRDPYYWSGFVLSGRP